MAVEESEINNNKVGKDAGELILIASLWNIFQMI